jgi:RNA polymerase sigma-70 factor (ECF subfamily)
MKTSWRRRRLRKTESALVPLVARSRNAGQALLVTFFGGARPGLEKELNSGPKSRRRARWLSHCWALARFHRGPVTDLSETELIAALADDDSETFERAFRAAYATHRSVVFGFLLRLAGDADTASDLFQNVWQKLAQHRRRLRPDTELRAWLCTVARREYLSYRRAQTLDVGRLLAFGREPAPDPTEQDSRLSEVNAALRRLSDADREVLLSTSVDGLSLRQAANVLGIAEPALRQRLVRARRRLETAIERERAAPTRRWFGAKKGET